MYRKKHITFKILLFLILIDFLETFAQFCFKKSAMSANSPEIKTAIDIINFIKQVVHSPFLWAGLFSVLYIFISWSTILSKIDLSVAVPVGSFSYITVPLVSMIFFHEHVSAVRWSGIFLIFGGGDTCFNK